MNMVFEEMMKAYRKRTGITEEDMSGFTKMQKARLFMIERGLIPMFEEDARLFLKLFDFTKEEQQIVQDAIVEKKKSSKTEFARFMQMYRIKNNMVLGEMARMAHASTSYASGVEHERYPLTNEYVKKLLHTLSLTEEERKELETFLK